MNEIQQWSDTNKFQLHPAKSKCVFPSLATNVATSQSRQSLLQMRQLNLFNQLKSLELKSLVQNDLRWNLHADISTKKAAKRLYFLVLLKRANILVKQQTQFYIACIVYYTLKTSGLKIPGHLKMTQFGSKMLLLTRLWVTFG